jgi:peptidyl-prolyl cis-trans isomerase B (cyclophilin B)
MAERSGREVREARRRARAYRARRAVHERRINRRRRDNLVAGIALVVVLALATGAQLLYFSGGPGTPKPSASPTPTPTPSAAAEGRNVGPVPSAELAEGRTWTGQLVLNDTVTLGIELDGAAAPQATSVFVSLAQSGFYPGKTCHRLTAAILQCGSANGDGTGDPGFTWGPVENAPADAVYPAGTIAMARTADPYGHGSQFFIVYKDTPLDPSTGGYTVFGRVTSGLDTLVSDIADAGISPAGSEDGAPVVPTSITSVSVQ